MQKEDKKNHNKMWDYGSQAKYYRFRPNYADKAIDALCKYVNAKKGNSKYIVADVGAGTGNLTKMLLERKLACIAIEPTKEMMAIGKKITRGMNVEWRMGTGEQTTLDDSSINWFTMGSSFNTTDRILTLKEAHRVLKKDGYFSCMWNHRDIENDIVQKNMERIIESIVPDYERGTRREGQADFILSSKLFNDVHYIEEVQIIQRTADEYINGWKSVKNKYWDMETKKGQAIFNKIEKIMRRELHSIPKIESQYTTRIWTAGVVK